MIQSKPNSIIWIGAGIACVALAILLSLLSSLPQKSLDGERSVLPANISSETSPAPLNKENGAIDVVVYVDEQSLGANPPGYDPIDDYLSITDEDLRRVIALADALMYEKTGMHIVLHDLRRKSFFGMPPASLEPNGIPFWLKNLVQTEDNPPEFVVIFSRNIGITWMFGGQSGVSLATDTDSTYCNEFSLKNGTVPETNIGQRGAGFAIVDWSHWVGGCGYDHETFPGLTRLSNTPTQGECRNDPTVLCVPRNDGRYHQCANTLDWPYADPDFFTAANVVHEITHSLDPEGLAHYGTPECNEAMQGNRSYDPTDPVTAQRSFQFCPKSFVTVRSTLKGCRTE